MSSERSPADAWRRRTGRVRRARAITRKRLTSEIRVARLTVIEGSSRGSKFTVEDGMTFGRSKAATVVLDAPDISRVHARIRTGRTHVIEDLLSRNGTFVNGVAVEGAVPLKFGDRVRIGLETIMLFSEFDPEEEELIQRQRLGLLGHMAAGVAYDVNGLLGAIVSTQEYLLNSPPDMKIGDAEIRDCLSEVREAAERAAYLMPKLLSVARGQGDSHGPFDISAVCAEVAVLAQSKFDSHIAVETDIAPGLTVVGGRGEIRNVIINLCMNAHDSMASGGTLTLSVKQTRSSGALVERRQRPVALIEVTDTGVGMDEETRAGIFRPSFSTERADGAGLGLATAKEVVDVHDGDIAVESKRGSGTVIRIELPLEARAERATVHQAREVRPAVVAHLMLVDDDPMCRRAFSRVLKRAGHRVDVAASGVEALEMLQTLPLSPDLVLLDLDMPQLSGEETLARLRALDPGMRVLVVTGNRSDERRQAVLDNGALGVVNKPFTQERLIDEIQCALRLSEPQMDVERTHAGGTTRVHIQERDRPDR